MDESFTETMKTRYSIQRVQWLIVTIATISIVYLSSEEIWKLMDNKPFPEICVESLVIYFLFFLILALLIHFQDVKRIVSHNSLAFVVSISSLVIDLGIIILAEFMVLYSIQVLPQNLFSIIGTLLIGAIPSCLGVVTISSITSDYLRKRAEKLEKEVKKLLTQIDELEDKWEERMKEFEEFEKKKREFELYIEKEKKKEGVK